MPKRGTRTLSEDRRRQQHDHERLDLLQDDRRHGVAPHECLREEDRRERRRSHADDDACGHVARTCAPQRRDGRHDEREQHGDEDHVLAEDDRRCLRRVREGVAQERVHSPEPSGNGDGGDT